ncbi:hypothetical protein [Motilibacter aurantiacus]|uniref:hypothetical protein n=1 Tax=Motilibacter aurantiacus TaxID=2714955 RepID=UPI00140853A8|nr:hypothetical protein [Motilibacter aurantiacus]NHC46740.1 hypothetical protein [Motilibacter aurantiacus]
MLVMQGDGNLAGYTDARKPTWARGAGGRGSGTFVAQKDGNLVVYSAGQQSDLVVRHCGSLLTNSRRLSPTQGCRGRYQVGHSRQPERLARPR